MICLPDDPIIRSIENTGYPPWFFFGEEEDGNEPFAVYDPE